MKKFVRAEEGPSNSVIYYDEDGNKLIRYWKSHEGQSTEEASTRSWRNNNPGNNAEYELLLDAMKKHEGWREGKEEFIEVKNVLGVHINRKKVIFEFLIGNSIESAWIPKKEAVVLAEAGLLHAIVVHTKGEPYLRPKYHHKSFRELAC